MSSRTPVANGHADLSPSFEALKEKLWKKTGTSVASMCLELHDETGTRVADLDRDAAPLAAYSPYDGCVRPPHSHLSLLHTAPDLIMVCSEGTGCILLFLIPRR
jgi:hypothetical protein